MADLTHADLDFDGAGTRSGGLTWAQQDIYGFVYGSSVDAKQENADTADVIDVADGLSVGDCLRILRAAVVRHQALRTKFTFHDSVSASQRVYGEGAIPVLVHSTRDCDVDEATRRVGGLLTGEPLDVTVQFPLRVGLVEGPAGVARIVLVASRMVVDGWGFQNLSNELQEGMGHSRPDDHGSSPGFHQLDQLDWEKSRYGKQRADAAVSYRRRIFEEFAGTSAKADFSGAADRPVRLGRVTLGSDFSETLRRVSRERNTSASSVLLASYALAVSENVTLDEFVLHIHTANRFDPTRAKSVTRLKGMSVMPYRRRSHGIEEEIKSVAASVLPAYRNSQFPPGPGPGTVESVGLSRRSGHPFFAEFNDRRIIPHGFDAELARSSPNSPDGDDSMSRAEGATVADSNRTTWDPYLCLAIDGAPSDGMSLELDTNILPDEKIVSTVVAFVERIMRFGEKSQ